MGERVAASGSAGPAQICGHPFEGARYGEKDQPCLDTIRTLSMDAMHHRAGFTSERIVQAAREQIGRS